MLKKVKINLNLPPNIISYFKYTRKKIPKILFTTFIILIICQTGLFLFANLFPRPTNAAEQLWTMPDIQIDISGIKNHFSTPTECGTDSQGNTIYCIPWIGEYIAAIYKYAIGVVGILAAVVLMIGGVTWIMAGGNATAIDKAKSWIGASLTGLLLALCSYFILYQINPALTVFNPLKITQVKKIKTATEDCRWQDVPNGKYCKDVLGSGWINSDASKCGEKKADYSLSTECCCIGCKPNIACEACNNCIPAENLTLNCKEMPCLINNDLAAKLLLVKNQRADWRITEGWPPTVNHLDSCHLKGTCVDINFLNQTQDPATVAALYRILVSSNINLKAVYEHPNCAAYTSLGVNCKIYPSTISPSFHVEL